MTNDMPSEFFHQNSYHFLCWISETNQSQTAKFANKVDPDQTALKETYLSKLSTGTLDETSDWDIFRDVMLNFKTNKQNLSTSHY